MPTAVRNVRPSGLIWRRVARRASSTATRCCHNNHTCNQPRQIHELCSFLQRIPTTFSAVNATSAGPDLKAQFSTATRVLASKGAALDMCRGDLPEHVSLGVGIEVSAE